MDFQSNTDFQDQFTINLQRIIRVILVLRYTANLCPTHTIHIYLSNNILKRSLNRLINGLMNLLTSANHCPIQPAYQE